MTQIRLSCKTHFLIGIISSSYVNKFYFSYSPEYLLMENVIVVTINYRLHVLGFLSIPSREVSGNLGYKDQQLALEWVHENISSFNGDAENICLFGYKILFFLL